MSQDRLAWTLLGASLVGCTIAAYLTLFAGFNKAHIPIAIGAGSLAGALAGFCLHQHAPSPTTAKPTHQRASRLTRPACLTLAGALITAALLLFHRSPSPTLDPTVLLLLTAAGTLTVAWWLLDPNAKGTPSMVLAAVLTVAAFSYVITHRFPGPSGNDVGFHLDTLAAFETGPFPVTPDDPYATSYGYHALLALTSTVTGLPMGSLVAWMLLFWLLAGTLLLLDLWAPEGENTTLPLIALLILLAGTFPYLAQARFWMFPGALVAYFIPAIAWTFLRTENPIHAYATLHVLFLSATIFFHPLVPLLILGLLVVWWIANQAHRWQDSPHDEPQPRYLAGLLPAYALGMILNWNRPSEPTEPSADLTEDPSPGHEQAPDQESAPDPEEVPPTQHEETQPTPDAPEASPSAGEQFLEMLTSPFTGGNVGSVDAATDAPDLDYASVFLSDIPTVILYGLAMLGLFYLLFATRKKVKDGTLNLPRSLTLALVLLAPWPFIQAVLAPGTLPGRWFPAVTLLLLFGGLAGIMILVTLAKRWHASDGVPAWAGTTACSALVILVGLFLFTSITSPSTYEDSELYAEPLSDRHSLQADAWATTAWADDHVEGTIHGSTKLLVLEVENPRDPNFTPNSGEIWVLRDYDHENGLFVPLYGHEGNLTATIDVQDKRFDDDQSIHVLQDAGESTVLRMR